MTDTATAEAEAIIRAAERSLIRPRRDEWLLCYVARLIGEIGCDTTLRFATAYRDVRAPRATGLERRLGNKGGFCDCEIFLNGYEIADRVWTDNLPTALPWCRGARRGSTQPCAVWAPLRLDGRAIPTDPAP